MAANFLLAATGVYLNPGAGGMAGHQPSSFARPPPPPGVLVTLAHRPAAAGGASTYRLSLVGAAPNSTTCVQLLDNWCVVGPPLAPSPPSPFF
eukprot:SAG22_NODE_428_length_10591_cov_8.858178_4_plen_93_part_00